MTNDTKPPFSRAFSAIFGLTLLGLGMFFIAFFFDMAKPHLVTRVWDETPCRITDCRLEKMDENVWLNISFRYEKWGDTYTSHLYDLNGGHGLNTGQVYGLWEKYRDLPETICFVNPQRPQEAVLSHGDGTKVWIMGLPLLLMFFGMLGVVRAVYPKIFSGQARSIQKSMSHLVRRMDGKPMEPGGTTPRTTLPRPFPEGRLVLKPGKRKTGRIWLIFILAVLWNGVVCFFAGQLAESWAQGNPAWLHLLFLIPFAAVGLFLAGWFFYHLFLWMNPAPVLTLDNGHICLGTGVSGSWDFKGSPSRIKRFVVSLEGREEATYVRGSDKLTDTRVFYRQILAEVADLRFYSGGHLQFTVPADTMHSFECGPFRIVWYLTVFGSIPLWPDINEEFRIPVMPCAADERKNRK